MAITVRVLAFARLRDLFGFGERPLEVAAGTTIDDVWSTLASAKPDAAAMRGSTRFARNGIVTDGGAALADGDEIALLPPVGGG